MNIYMYTFFALVFVFAIICFSIALPGLKNKHSKTYPPYPHILLKDPEPEEEAGEETEPEIKEQEKKQSPSRINTPLTEEEREERDRRSRELEEEKRPEREKQRKKDRPCWLKFNKVYSAVPYFLEILKGPPNITRSCDCSEVVYFGTHYNCDSIAHAVICVKCSKRTDWDLNEIEFIFKEQHEKYQRRTNPERFEPEPKAEEEIIKPLGLRIKITTQPRKKKIKKKRKKRVQNKSGQSRTEQKKEEIPSVDLDELRRKIKEKGGF